MRIFNYGDSIQKLDKTYLRQSRSAEQGQKTSEDSRSKNTDEIILSPKVAELQKYQEIAKSIPEIREDKANSIKAQIESSNYSVNGKSVAKSIIDLIG